MNSKKKKKNPGTAFTYSSGIAPAKSRSDGIRTHDLCVPNAALYQAEPCAVKYLFNDSIQFDLCVPNAALYVVSFADPAEPCAVKRMLNDNILICLPHTSEALCSLRSYVVSEADPAALHAVSDSYPQTKLSANKRYFIVIDCKCQGFKRSSLICQN